MLDRMGAGSDSIADLSSLERAVAEAEQGGETARSSRGPGGPGPPPLAAFGLVLHHDGSWTHEGQPFRNRRLREKFDRSVRYLPDEGEYVVQIGRFRGLVEVEEAGFFVRELDPEGGTVSLSDGSTEPLEVDSLRLSERDGALLCRVKRALVAEGLPARFSHSAQADFMNAVSDSGDEVELGGGRIPLPPL
jgi:hypothetical protein